MQVYPQTDTYDERPANNILLVRAFLGREDRLGRRVMGIPLGLEKPAVPSPLQFLMGAVFLDAFTAPTG